MEVVQVLPLHITSGYLLAKNKLDKEGKAYLDFLFHFLNINSQNRLSLRLFLAERVRRKLWLMSDGRAARVKSTSWLHW